jgi:RNA-binding protein
MALNSKQKRKLRALAHSLKPVVQIGQRGVTEAVAQQVETALNDHELIKVRIGAESPTDRNDAASLLIPRTGCEVAGIVGRVLILYRPHPDHPRIRLDDGLREATNRELAGPAARRRSIKEEPA